MAKLIEFLMDETSGTAVDNTGTLGASYDGSITGSAAFTGTGGIDFSGGRVEFGGTGNILNGAGACTFIVAFNPDVIAASTYYSLLAKNQHWTLQIWDQSGATRVEVRLDCATTDATDLNIATSPEIEAGNDYVLAMRYDGSNNYVYQAVGWDGAISLIETIGGSGAVVESGGVNKIGVNQFNFVPFDGVIRYVAIWDEDIGASGIQDYIDARAGGGSVSGALAATETGTDALAAAGTVEVQGDLAAAEAGADTAAASGSAEVTGAFAATEAGADVLAASGDVTVAGDLTATEAGPDTAVIDAAVVVQGDLAVAEVGADVFAGTGGQVTTGTMAATETGTDVFAGTGGVLIRGGLLVAESNPDVLAAAGSILVSGALVAAEVGADVLAAAGGVVVTGAMAAVETGADVFEAIETPPVEAQLGKPGFSLIERHGFRLNERYGIHLNERYGFH